MLTPLANLTLAVALSLTPDPHALVERSLAALRHDAPADAIASVRLAGAEHTWMLGNAERSEGPWRVSYTQFSELYDLRDGKLRRTETPVPAPRAPAPERITVLTDSVAGYFFGPRFVSGSHAVYEDFIDRVDAGLPMRALRLASESKGLVYERSVARWGVVHDVVSFPWRNGRMRLELSRDSHLPDAIEVVRPYPDNFRWAPFGDVTIRTENVDWTVTPSGAYWPMQQKVALNGEPLRDVTYASAALETTSVPADSFAFADSARARYAAASAQNFSRFRFGMRGKPSELAPGIVRVPDFWTQTLVKQDDGVVIFEAHISAQYLHEVIDEAHARWPGAPIKALVMTSDPWAHLGGVREAMALGIPIYVQQGSVPFLTKVATAPHALAPDSLARSRRKPRFVPVSARTVIGTGENRIELYPVGGPYAERMLMAYFPARKLLYGADLVFFDRGPDGKPTKSFLATPATDLRNAVARVRLAVETLFCVQNYARVAWCDFAGGAAVGAGR
jgi:hypothetical protein